MADLSRRQTIMAIGGVALGASLGPLAKAAFGAGGDLLVVVFLRGGCDGLHLVAPVGDPAYGAARGPGLRVAESGPQRGFLLTHGLDGGHFLLHPKARGIHELYQQGHLAIVHATGLPHATRSHFEAQALVERGVADFGRVRDGWLSRYLAMRAGSDLAAVTAGSLLPESLLGARGAVSLSSPAEFQLTDDPALMRALDVLYGGEDELARAGQATLRAIARVQGRLARDREGKLLPYRPRSRYPQGEAAELSTAFQAIAQLAKLHIGMRVATVDHDGWDTHQDQASRFSNQVERLSSVLNAFYEDMADERSGLTVVVISEFGRRVAANDSGGTDHGHGGVMLVLGSHVNGGRMYGRWPGLRTDQLDEERDLAITTDYRSVLGEIGRKRLGNPDLAQLFPGFSGTTSLGIVRA